MRHLVEFTQGLGDTWARWHGDKGRGKDMPAHLIPLHVGVLTQGSGRVITDTNRLL
jgi:hypothetical protein